MSKQLGANIRRARKSANLSQSQLAAKIGAHVTSVSDWERGRNAPSARHLLSIAEATGQELAFFYTDPDEEAAPVGERFPDEGGSARGASARDRVVEGDRGDGVAAA